MLSIVGEPSVQLELTKVPPPDVVKFTVPDTGDPAPDASTVAVHVTGPPPCTSDGGLQLTVVIAPLLTVNVCAFDTPPPGAGLTTVIEELPMLVMSLAGICAVSCVALTNVVGRTEPLNKTVEVETKPVPFTVSVSGRDW